MSIKDELLFDFAVSLPRVMVCGNVTIVDYVKRIAEYSQDKILLHNGERYTCLTGKALILKEIRNGRVLITGELEEVRFFETLCDSDG